MAFELTVGALCAAGGRERLAAREDPYASPAFRAGLLYSALFYVPAAVVFVRVWSDWSSHYLFDTADAARRDARTPRWDHWQPPCD